jgi:hypothetical protein
MGPIIGAIMGVCLILLCFKFYFDKKRNLENGKIEIKFTKSDAEEATNSVRFTDLILEIRYRLIRRQRYNKEEVAILISDLVRCRCKRFKIKYSTEKTIEEIKDIIEKIKPLLSHEMDSELTDVNYRIYQTTIPRWAKDIFSETELAKYY